MSRQSAVHVLAGCMILTSVALAHCVSPWWLILAGFVGANLFQSGFTGFCPAEAMFAKLSFRDRACAGDIQK